MRRGHSRVHEQTHEIITLVLITLDATPLLGPRTGIGRYVEHLLAELPGAIARRQVDAHIRATTWTARGARLANLPAGVGPTSRRSSGSSDQPTSSMAPTSSRPRRAALARSSRSMT